MTLSELITAVYTETNRPDLVPETLQSVLEATITCHAFDDWYKDIQEAFVTFDNPLSYIQALETRSLPYLRKFAYIRKTNPNINPVENYGQLLPNLSNWPPHQYDFVERVDIGDILDTYGYEKNDIWYQAGSQINIKSSTPLQYATIGWYKFPNVDATGVNFSSWIAIEYPYAIIYRAAGTVFSKIGQDVAAALYLRKPAPRQGLDSGGMYYEQMGRILQANIRAS